MLKDALLHCRDYRILKAVTLHVTHAFHTNQKRRHAHEKKIEPYYSVESSSLNKHSPEMGRCLDAVDQ